MRQRADDTENVLSYLRDCHFTVEFIYECEWLKQKAESHEIKKFAATLLRPMDHRVFMTTENIIAAIKNDDIFGVVECDLRVPRDLERYFSEMPPIFKNAEIGRADIGQHMREFAEEADLLRHPRRSLIGSFHASRQLFITPLLKWYMNHGLEVTRVYQVRITCISYAGTLCTFFIRYILY